MEEEKEDLLNKKGEQMKQSLIDGMKEKSNSDEDIIHFLEEFGF